MSFSRVHEKLCIKIKMKIFTAATYSSYSRNSSPMNGPILLHDHNEYLEDVLLKAIGYYYYILRDHTITSRLPSDKLNGDFLHCVLPCYFMYN